MQFVLQHDWSALTLPCRTLCLSLRQTRNSESSKNTMAAWTISQRLGENTDCTLWLIINEVQLVKQAAGQNDWRGNEPQVCRDCTMGTWWTGGEWQIETQTHTEAITNSCGGFTISLGAVVNQLMGRSWTTKSSLQWVCTGVDLYA